MDAISRESAAVVGIDCADRCDENTLIVFGATARTLGGGIQLIQAGRHAILT
jgi:hypothetical protein